MKRPFTQTSGTQTEATDVSNGTPPTSGVSVRTAIFLYAAKVGIIPLKNKSTPLNSPKITRFQDFQAEIRLSLVLARLILRE